MIGAITIPTRAPDFVKENSIYFSKDGKCSDRTDYWFKEMVSRNTEDGDITDRLLAIDPLTGSLMEASINDSYRWLVHKLTNEAYISWSADNHLLS